MRRRVGRLVAHLAVAGWLLITLVMFVRGAVPLDEPIGRDFPWGMFKDPSSRSKRLVMTAILADGSETELDPGRYFHYARGATSLRFYDHAKALRRDKKWAKRQGRDFARLVAKYARERDGIDAIAVRMEWERVHLRSRKVQTKRIHDVVVIDKDTYRRVKGYIKRREKKREMERRSPLPIKSPDRRSRPRPDPDGKLPPVRVR